MLTVYFVFAYPGDPLCFFTVTVLAIHSGSSVVVVTTFVIHYHCVSSYISNNLFWRIIRPVFWLVPVSSSFPRSLSASL